jgi:hypothetical protein
MQRTWFGVSCALLMGLSLFFIRYDARIVNPLFTNWLLVGGDAAMNQIGWEYFRSEPWSWPPGSCVRYGAPLGSSIAMTDSIPLLALPGKLLAGKSGVSWQYFGFWILSNTLLQSLFSWLVLGGLVRRPLPRLLGAGLLSLMPSFLARAAHIALGSHWLILAALVAYRRRLGLRWWVGLAAVSALVHPYLATMVFGVAVARFITQAFVARDLRLWRTAACLLLMSVTMAFCWILSGMFVYGMKSGLHEVGYELFSANLNSLYNPTDRALVLRGLPLLRPHQGEGFNYLGIGLLPLWGLALCCTVVVPTTRQMLSRHLGLVAVVGIFSLYALSNVVTYGSRVLLSHHLPALLDSITGSLRVPGRFLWPLTYAGSVFAIWNLTRSTSRRVATVVLVALLGGQILDQAPVFARPPLYAHSKVEIRLQNPVWAQLRESANALITVPLMDATTQYPYDFRDLDIGVCALKIPTSAAYLARSPREEAATWYRAFLARLDHGDKPPPGEVFVIRDSEFVELYRKLAPEFVGYQIDGFRVCAHRDIVLEGAVAYDTPVATDLASFLEQHQRHMLVVAAKDEATAGLDDRSRELLKARGVTIDGLSYRCSFGAILTVDGVAWQSISNGNQVEYHLQEPVDIFVRSAGLNHGNTISIAIGGIEQAFATRGLNILVLDGAFNLREIGVFDTCVGTAGYSLAIRPSSTPS